MSRTRRALFLRLWKSASQGAWQTGAAVLILLAIPVLTVWAQAISGNLVGTVLDPSGAGIPNATVTATNLATNVKSSTTANSHGEYRLNNLPPGMYSVAAEASGFTRAEVQHVSVQLNLTATVPLTLQVGTAATSINVVESSAPIDTTNAQIQSTFNARQSSDLPNTSIGAGVVNLSLLSAGVSSSGGLGAGTGPSVGGQRPRNNNFTIEGVDDNSKTVTGPQVTVPNDAVAEFTLLQNQFQAEFGHSSGGQFNTIVKSGTNSFHGQLYEYLRNRTLNALDQAYANQGIYSNPRYDNNRLGANMGGPIIKDKWFYFADFEYNPIGQASTTGAPAYAPTAAGYSLLSGLPGISQTNLSQLQKYAVAPSESTDPSAPTVSVRAGNNPANPLINIPLGIVNTVGPNFQNNYSGVLSSDFNISDRDQLRGRFIYNRNSIIDTGANLPVFYTSYQITSYLGTLAWFHTFTPSLTNEFRLGYNRQNQNYPVGDFKYPGLDQFPNLVFQDLNLQVGYDENFPQFGITNMYQGVDNLTWSVGKHTFKFGSDFRKYIAPQQFIQRSRGDYEYTTLGTFLFDQTPDYLSERGLGTATFYGDQIATYSYAQDTWRIRPNLTLDLGARYEYLTIPYTARLQTLNSIADAPGVLTFQRPTAPTMDIVPRIGIAYSPGNSQNTVIRAGFGMAYDRSFDNLPLLSLPPEFTTLLDNTGEATPAGGFLASGGILPTASAGGPSSVDDARANTSAYIPAHEKLPYSINWSFDIQHVFARNYTLDIRYLGTRGVHLPAQVQLNRISLVSPSSYIPTFLTAPSAATLAGLPLTVGDLQAQSSLDPAFAAAGFTTSITSYQPEGSSTYHGLAVQLNRRFSNGLQFIGSYTWSHAIDNSTAEVYSTELSPRRAQDFRNLRAERSSSLLDRRQRFSLEVLYDAPWFKSKNNWFLKNVIGNWEVTPIYTYESPEFYTVQSGVDANLNHDTAGDRTIFNPQGVYGTGTGVYALDRSGNRVDLTTFDTTSANPIVAYVAKNPNAQYIQAQRGALANAGRNTLPTRPIDNVDLTLLKRFNITERFHLELAGQALNLLNHPQFIPGSIDDVSAIDGTGLSSYTQPQSPAFNNPELIFSSNPRTIQVFAKLNW